jgi:hypothetical protein
VDRTPRGPGVRGQLALTAVATRLAHAEENDHACDRKGLLGRWLGDETMGIIIPQRRSSFASRGSPAKPRELRVGLWRGACRDACRVYARGGRAASWSSTTAAIGRRLIHQRPARLPRICAVAKAAHVMGIKAYER